MDPTTATYAAPAGVAALLAFISAHGREIPHAIHLLHHVWGPAGGVAVGVVIGASLQLGPFWSSVLGGIGSVLGYMFQESVEGQ